MTKSDSQNPVVVKLTAESQYWFDRSQQLENALADAVERRDDAQEGYEQFKRLANEYSHRLDRIAELHCVAIPLGFRPRMNPGKVTPEGIDEMIREAKDFKAAALVSDLSAAVGFRRPEKKATKAAWEEYAAVLEDSIRQLRAKYNRNGKR